MSEGECGFALSEINLRRKEQFSGVLPLTGAAFAV